jgi:hypothetical protein
MLKKRINNNKSFYYKLYLIHKNKCDKKNIKDIYHISIKNYNYIKKDIQNIFNENFNEKKFNEFFLSNYKMNFNIYKIYDYLLDNNSILKLDKYQKIDFLNIVGTFLELYTCNKNPNRYTINNLSLLIKSNCFIINESTFKENLKLLMFFGNKIIIEVNNNSKIETYYEVFTDKLSNIFCDIKICENIENNKITNSYPKNYNWFIYINYYTLILCQKLYLDYKLLNIINKQYLDEIFNYIPNLNCSKNTIRTGIVAHIINIRFLIALIFKFNNKYIDINIFLFKNIKTLQINFIEPNNDLIFFPDGGIICNNMINYNIIYNLLFPYTFYYLLYNKYHIFEENLNIILRSIFKMLSNIKLINPGLINNKKTSVLYNNLIEYFYIAQYLNILKNNTYLSMLAKYKLNSSNFEHIKSVNLLSVKYTNWSIQLKLPSKYIIGILYDTNNYLNQLLTSKILLFNKISFDNFRQKSIYPGMLFYNKEVINPPGSYVITKFDNMFLKNDNYFISFSKICSQELNLIYNELIFITPYGIIVGYFNIIKLIDGILFMCYNSPIYNNCIDTGILYSDNKCPENIKKKYYIKVDTNILYYNFYFKTHINLLNISFDDYNNIKLKIIIDNKVYDIFLNYTENKIDVLHP